MKFNELGLIAPILKALTAQGYCRAVRQMSGWKTQMLCR